jgi:hypothetical protein
MLVVVPLRFSNQIFRVGACRRRLPPDVTHPWLPLASSALFCENSGIGGTPDRISVLHVLMRLGERSTFDFTRMLNRYRVRSTSNIHVQTLAVFVVCCKFCLEWCEGLIFGTASWQHVLLLIGHDTGA